MSLEKRLYLAFGISLLVATIIGIFGYTGISGNVQETESIIGQDLDLFQSILTLKIEALQHRRFEKDFFLNIGNPEKQAKYIQKFDSKSQSLLTRLDHIQELSAAYRDYLPDLPTETKTAADAYKKYYAGFKTLTKEISGNEQISPQEANKLMMPIKDQIYIFESGIDEMETMGKQYFESIAHKTSASGKSLVSTILIVLGLGFVIILFVSLTTIRRLRFGLNAITRQLDEISSGAGDLTQRISVEHQDEIGHLSGLFNQFMENLQGMIKQIGANAEAVASSSAAMTEVIEQLSDGSANSSLQAEAIASAAEEMNVNSRSIASAMEEATTSMSVIAEAAKQLGNAVNEIAQSSEQARSITSNAVTQSLEAADLINQLDAYSEKIGKVTEVITDISEQTNLLALNATIEAARAGEAGRGFAVVSNEIKELANQTSDATKDIKQQIDSIQEATKKGVEIIRAVADVVQQVDESVSSIAAAVEEQSVTTSDINGNVNQALQGLQDINSSLQQSTTAIDSITREINGVSEVTKTIASGSRQLNTNAGEQYNIATDLQKLVEVFKV